MLDKGSTNASLKQRDLPSGRRETLYRLIANNIHSRALLAGPARWRCRLMDSFSID